MTLKASFDGFTYFTNDPSFAWHINNGKSEPYTPDEKSIVERFLFLFPERNRTYIDVGAHIGTTVLPYSRLFKTVYAFEPNSESYNLLEQNVKLNNINNVIMKNVGISNKNTNGELIKHGDNSGCYYFKENTEGTVKSIILDEQLISDVDFIKVDTEGSELLVLQSAEELLKKYKPLIHVEVNGHSEKFFNIKKNELHNYLVSLGFSIFDDSCIDNIFYF
jgi:FkbM family methyltransferase